MSNFKLFKTKDRALADFKQTFQHSRPKAVSHEASFKPDIRLIQYSQFIAKIIFLT